MYLFVSEYFKVIKVIDILELVTKKLSLIKLFIELQ